MLIEALTFPLVLLLLFLYYKTLLSQKLRSLLIRILFHGNVEIAICLEHHRKDFKGNISNICRKPLGRTPLLYPVKQKNYSAHPFIEAEWNQLRHFLQHAYFLTIFGYANLKTDVEARELLLNE